MLPGRKPRELGAKASADLVGGGVLLRLGLPTGVYALPRRLEAIQGASLLGPPGSRRGGLFVWVSLEPVANYWQRIEKGHPFSHRYLAAHPAGRGPNQHIVIADRRNADELLAALP